MSDGGKNDMPDMKTFDRDSIPNTLIISIGLSLVCSILVASAAVVLKPIQLKNAEEYRQRIILEVAGLMQPGADIAELFTSIQPDNVEISSGESVEIYLEKDGGTVKQIILPISGPGLWSTMRGYLAVAPDGNTVKGIRFFEHAETPGLGDQIDKEDWRALWVGKHIFDEDNSLRIEVVRGFVPRDGSNPDAVHQIDGLSGATLTGNGVTKLVQHWMGPEGFGPYLETFK
jgi:Na+-transporting NADH:ubiquinone oxidoreductase subunit C